ncbi:MAG: hypothetical protein H5T92_10090, partial [Synergistales bacterium]|nr:hypothetical protein [Synergistales bacterium]
MMRLQNFIACCVAFCVSFSAWAQDHHVIWLETEKFENRGGWVNDAQFVDQMGSPFLLAIGLEGPVQDASTTVNVPKAGLIFYQLEEPFRIAEHIATHLYDDAT